MYVLAGVGKFAQVKATMVQTQGATGGTQRKVTKQPRWIDSKASMAIIIGSENTQY